MPPIIEPTPNKQPTKASVLLSSHWITPFTFGSFLLTTVTGILLFFKIHIGLVKPVHEWLSWLVVIAAVFHLARNSRPFVASLTRPVGIGVVAIFLLVLGCSFLPGKDAAQGKPHRGRSAEHITRALAHAPLATVAQVAELSPEKVLQLLDRQGIVIEGLHQRIVEIAENNKQHPSELVAFLFQGSDPAVANTKRAEPL